MVTPQELADKAKQNPAEAGALLLAFGLLLKVAFLIKVISWTLLTFGLIFLWEAFRPRLKTQQLTNGENSNVRN